MKTTRRTVSTGNGIHAKRRVSMSAQQPLKPKFSASRFLIIFIALCLSLSVYVQQNLMEIGLFINRPVSKVRMDEQWQQISAAEIQRLLSSYLGKGFFNIDVDQIKTNLERHPWIAQASVKRIWPDSLALQITEHIAIARWGETQLLNQYGEIFNPTRPANLQQLPILRGPAESQFVVMQQYQKFNQQLFPAGMRLTELSLSARGSWDLTVNDSMKVAVGRVNLADKLDRFVRFYDAQSKEKSELFRAIDLRYSNGIAVKNRDQDITGVAVR